MHWVDPTLDDKLIWAPNRSGKFSVKSTYHLASNVSTGDFSLDVIWKVLWKMKIPERLKFLVWKIAVNGLPVRMNLINKLSL